MPTLARRCFARKPAKPANVIQFVLIETVQIFEGNVSFPKKLGKQEWKNRVSIIIFAIDTFATLGQIILQLPYVRRSLDPAGPFLNLLDDRVKLPMEGAIVDSAPEKIVDAGQPSPRGTISAGRGKGKGLGFGSDVGSPWFTFLRLSTILGSRCDWLYR